MRLPPIVSSGVIRRGHAASGRLTSLAIKAVLIIEQGAEFPARVAIAPPVTLPGIAVYMVAFVLIGHRRGWVAALRDGWEALYLVVLPCSYVNIAHDLRPDGDAQRTRRVPAR